MVVISFPIVCVLRLSSAVGCLAELELSVALADLEGKENWSPGALRGTLRGVQELCLTQSCSSYSLGHKLPPYGLWVKLLEQTDPERQLVPCWSNDPAFLVLGVCAFMPPCKLLSLNLYPLWCLSKSIKRISVFLWTTIYCLSPLPQYLVLRIRPLSFKASVYTLPRTPTYTENLPVDIDKGQSGTTWQTPSRPLNTLSPLASRMPVCHTLFWEQSETPQVGG